MATKSNHTALKAGLGAAVAAVAAAAAGDYFFGKDGKKHRKTASAWMDKAKDELVAELQKLKSVSGKSYYQAAARVIAKYQKFEKDHPKEFGMLKKELKDHWKKIEKHLPAKI